MSATNRMIVSEGEPTTPDVIATDLNVGRDATLSIDLTIESIFILSFSLDFNRGVAQNLQL
jgi:hypothetical protein